MECERQEQRGMTEQTISFGARDVIGAALIERAQRDDAFRVELTRDPRSAVERALGLLLPERLRIEVLMEQSSPRPLAVTQPAPVAVPA
jgi:hypothetical protein